MGFSPAEDAPSFYNGSCTWRERNSWRGFEGWSTSAGMMLSAGFLRPGVRIAHEAQCRDCRPASVQHLPPVALGGVHGLSLQPLSTLARPRPGSPTPPPVGPQ